MISNKKHIIFDWNGTLVDDAWIFVDILNALLIPRGLKKITLKEYQASFCFPIKLFYKNLGVDVAKKSFIKLEKEFMIEYNQRMYKPKLFNSVKNILKYLLNRGIGFSVLSASNERILHELVEYYSLAECFDYIVGVDNYGANGKIESGKNLINKLKLNSNEVLIIGDTDYDYEVASSLNIDCMLKSGGHQSRERLIKKTDNIIDSLEDIIHH